MKRIVRNFVGSITSDGRLRARLYRGGFGLLAALCLLILPTGANAAGGSLGSKAVRTPGAKLPMVAKAADSNSQPDRDDSKDDPKIVGMWHVVFTANTLNGSSISNTVIDNALVVWHADKTEIMNSVRPPQDGNFCLGVWEKTGALKYSANHFAWFANAFPTNPPTDIGPPVGPTRITETVTLSSDGSRYSGSFTLTAYDTSGNVTTTFTGVLTGTRITIDTKTADLF